MKRAMIGSALALMGATASWADDDRSNDGVYFGTLHGHSSRSIDAYGLGNRTGPDDAYLLARGEQVNG